MRRPPAKANTRLINFRASAGLMAAARRAARRADTDLSKFIRQAIREKARHAGEIAD